MKLFDAGNVARGYVTSRPYFHPIVIAKIEQTLLQGKKFRYGLDVGCGAGLSTVALKEICDRVIGVDASEEMVASAIRGEGITYYPFPAEDIPLNETFDIITLSGAIDWVDRPKFFQEAKRLLSVDGFIVIYDNDFSGKMKGVSEFRQWYVQFLEKYPRPPRDSSPLNEKQLHESGFQILKTEEYSNEIEYSLKEFIDYLFTQSNVVVALESVDAGRLRDELVADLEPFFEGRQQTLIYRGYIWYVQPLKTE